FGFVRAGSANLGAEGEPNHPLGEGDAFVIPPRRAVAFSDVSADFEYVEVALPGGFPTEILSA
ncbi:MAG: cupin, partial [Armatimonadota bacterium]